MTRRRRFLFFAVLSGARRLRAANVIFCASRTLFLARAQSAHSPFLQLSLSPLASVTFSGAVVWKRATAAANALSGKAEIKVQIGCVTNIFMQQQAAVYLFLTTIF